MFIHSPTSVFDPEQFFPEVPFQQSRFYANWQEAYGREVLRLLIEDKHQKKIAYVQCVSCEFPVVGKVWYAARGPIGTFPSIKSEEVFYEELTDLCRSKGGTFIRFQKKVTSQYVALTKAEKKPAVFMPPNTECMLPLTNSFEDTIAHFGKSMRPDARKKNENLKHIIVTEDALDHLNTCYDLLNKSAEKGNFSLHPFSYYKALFKTIATYPNKGFIVLTTMQESSGELVYVSVNIYLHTGKECYFLFGGNDERGFPEQASMFNQIAAIEEMHRRGVKQYNMGGIADAHTPELASVTTFKMKFGCTPVEHKDTFDIPLRYFRYVLFRVLRLRVFVYIRKLQWAIKREIVRVFVKDIEIRT